MTTIIKNDDVNTLQTIKLNFKKKSYIIEIKEFKKEIIESNFYPSINLTNRYFITINNELSNKAKDLLSQQKFDFLKRLEIVDTFSLTKILMSFRDLKSKDINIKTQAINNLFNEWNIII